MMFNSYTLRCSTARIIKSLGLYYKSKLELKSNWSEILPVNCKFICVQYFFFALKVRLTNLKFEFCQFKLE